MKKVIICILAVLLVLPVRSAEDWDEAFGYSINAYSTNLVGVAVYDALLVRILAAYDFDIEPWVAGLIPSGRILFPIPVDNSYPKDFAFEELNNPYKPYFKQQFNYWGDWRIHLSGSMDVPRTPFGIYMGLSYKTVEVLTNQISNRAHYVCPDFGIRLRFGDEARSDWAGLIELGAEYDFAEGYKGLYSEKNAVNSGFVGRLAAGFSYNSLSVIVQYDHPFYSFFNTNYTPDNGATIPFAGVNRKIAYMSLGVRFGL